MRIEIADRVFETWPDYRRYVIVAAGVDNAGDSGELKAILRRAEAAVRENPALENYKEIPRIDVWRTVFTDMGLNPNRFPPSIANLVKRTRAGKDLPFINSLVAIFNVVSLEHIAPLGGDDLDAVKGDLRLGPASGDEVYTPLGKPDESEHPDPGEIILHDTGTGSVFCRGWCWKNGDPSKITETTRRVAINVDAMMQTISPGEHEQAAKRVMDLLSQYCGGTAELHLLSPENPGFSV